jgi:L-seryl-tRNA(Ser) seleniumtransferase
MAVQASSRAYEILLDLGVTPVINAAGEPSRLGQSILAEPVREAMMAAAQYCVPVSELQRCACELIASATGAEAGCVMPGAAAGLYLAAAACMAGTDPAAMDRLPDTTGLRNEIVVHRAHRNAFDHAIRASGVRFVEFGYLGAVSGAGAYAWQLEEAITERTAAAFYPGFPAQSVLPLPEVAEIAHSHGIPLIVDGAGTLVSPGNLRRFITEGADLVCFSGGKAIGGPSASGILAGRRDLILSATMQQQDMYVRKETWSGPFGMPMPEVFETPPHQGMGRMLKVGREEIAGLIVALKLFLARDHEAERAQWLKMMTYVATQLRDAPGSVAHLQAPPAVPIAQVAIRCQGAQPAAKAAAISRDLQRGHPRVFCDESQLAAGTLVLNPINVQDDELEPLIARMMQSLRDAT